MVTVTFELPEDVFSSVRKDPDHFAKELRLAAAVNGTRWSWFPKAGQPRFLGLSRSQFISALSRFEVPAFQYDVTEIREEVNRKP